MKTKLDAKYCGLVNELVGVRGYSRTAPTGRVERAVGLAQAAIVGRWPGTPICNPEAATDLRAAAAQLIEEAERVEGYNAK